jgi:hypothetical protein
MRVTSEGEAVTQTSGQLIRAKNARNNGVYGADPLALAVFRRFSATTIDTAALGETSFSRHLGSALSVA